MLKLLSCAKGHHWETTADDEGVDVGQVFCPVCGGIADTVPVLDLAPTDAPAEEILDAVPVGWRDARGRPVVSGYEILEERGKTRLGVACYKARQVLVNRVVLLKVVLAREDPGQVAWGALRGEAS